MIQLGSAEGDPDLLSLVCELHDAAMLVAPRGWVALALELGFGVPDLRVVRLDAEPPDGPAHPEMGVSRAGELERLGSGLTELRELLRARGIAWSAGAARARRGPDGARWTFGEAEVVLEPPTLDVLLYTDRLMALLDETQPAWRARQGSLAALLANVSGYRVEQERRRITFARAGDAPLAREAELIGTWAREPEAWHWSWANDSIDPAMSRRVHAACNPEAAAPGLSLLWRPAFPCAESFIPALTGLVAERIGAEGVWAHELDGGTAYLAIMP